MQNRGMSEGDLDLADARLLEDLQEELDDAAEGKENVLSEAGDDDTASSDAEPNVSSVPSEPGKTSKRVSRKLLLHKAVSKLTTPALPIADAHKEPDPVNLKSPRKSKSYGNPRQNIPQAVSPDPDILAAIMGSNAGFEPTKVEAAPNAKRRGRPKKDLKAEVKKDKSKATPLKQHKSGKDSTANAKKRGRPKKGLKAEVKKDKSKATPPKQHKNGKGSNQSVENIDPFEGQDIETKEERMASKSNITAEKEAIGGKDEAKPAQKLTGGPAPECKEKQASMKPKAKGKKGKKAKGKAYSSLDDGKSGQDLSKNVADSGGDTEEDEAERENCDWEKHPAEAIIASTWHNKLIVKRKGLNLTEYGLVDAARVKRQRLAKHEDGPVSLQMLAEYEAWEADFRRSISQNTVDGALELDDLDPVSPLESCYYLGKMLEANYPLSKAQKGVDPSRKIPVMALSKISQRLLNLATDRATKAEAEVQLLRQQVSALEAARVSAV